MKKLILFAAVILFFSGLTTVAQITITQNDMPAINTKIITAIDTVYNGTIGAAGTNLNWIFNSLLNQKTDTMVFTDPAGTPCASSFPTATHRASIENGYGYFKLSASSLEILGICGDLMGTGDDITAVLTPSQIFITFPSTYNTNFSGSTIMTFTIKNPGTDIPTSIVDSIRLKQTNNYSSNMDGWGQVFIPSGTYQSIRQAYSEIKTDSIFIRCKVTLPPYCSSPGWKFAMDSTGTDISFRWWSDSLKFTALEINTAGDSTIKEAQYHLSTGVSVNDMGTPSFAIMFSPNPGSNLIRVIAYGIEPSMAVISDFTGRVIERVNFNHSGTMISTGNYPSGIYLCRIVDREGRILGKGKFSVTK